MRRLAVVVLCVLALGACGKNDKKDSGAKSSTTVTTAAPTTTTTALVSGPPQTPQAAADGLYNAWTEGNTPQAQSDAANYAKPDVIAKIFKTPYSSATKYDRQQCTPQGGQFNCVWTYEGGSMQMTVENWPGGGYVVSAVIFVAD